MENVLVIKSYHLNKAISNDKYNAENGQKKKKNTYAERENKFERGGTESCHRTQVFVCTCHTSNIPIRVTAQIRVMTVYLGMC